MRGPAPRSLLQISAWLIALAAPLPAGAEPFWYAQAARESVPLPVRYTSELPAWFEPEPSFGTWRRRIDTILDGPTHLQWRICRGDEAVQARVVDAVRRSFAGSQDDYVTTRRSMVIGVGCGMGTRDERQLRCEWLRRVARSEPAGRVRDEFFGQLLSCAGPEDLALFEADAPDFAVAAFHRDHGPFGWSERLAGVLRNGVATSQRSAVQAAVETLSRIDDPRVARLILALLDAAEDPELRRILADGLVHQSDPDASEAFQRHLRIQCETERDAREAPISDGDALRMLGYVVRPTTPCDTIVHQPTPPPGRERRGASVVQDPDPSHAPRASLARFTRDRGLLPLNAVDPGAVGSQAPFMRRMADLVAPDLDGLVLEEVWPALDGFAFERGSELGFTTIDRLGFTLGVRDERDVAKITDELRAALAAPHWVDAYLDGSRLRFPLRSLGSRYDIETVVGAMNELLELRGSEQRFLLLAPDQLTGWPHVLAGPRSQLLDAVRAGVVRPATTSLSPDREM